MKKFSVVLMSILVALGSASASEVKTGKDAMSLMNPDTEKQVQKINKAVIKAQRNLPIKSISLVETEGGTFYISDDGRFAFVGQLIDTWNQKAIVTIDDVTKYANKVDIARMGVKSSDYSTFKVGSGKKEVTIFVDPNCPHCGTILSQIEPLKKEYTFNIALIPLLGQRSTDFVKKLDCSKDKKAAEQALFSKNDQFIASIPENCNPERVQKAVIFGRMLGIEGVPYMIRHDGQIKKGGTREFASWLGEAN